MISFNVSYEGIAFISFIIPLIIIALMKLANTFGYHRGYDYCYKLWTNECEVGRIKYNDRVYDLKKVD